MDDNLLDNTKLPSVQKETIGGYNDETLANFIKQSTKQKGEKEGTKREDPSLSQKS